MLWRVALGVLAVLSASFVYIWWLAPAPFIAGPLRLVRGPDGHFEPASEAELGGASAKVSVEGGALKAQNSLSASSSSTSSNPDCFASRSLALMNLSDHPLMRRVGADLLELLKQDAQLDVVEYYPPGSLPEPGSLAPDLLCTIDLDSIEESGLVGRTLKAEVDATLGTELAQSNHHVHDNLTPLGVQFSADIRLDHQSEFTGVESSAARYKQQAANIAEQLAGSIRKHIDGLREKHGASPALPEAFTPAYEPPPEFKFLAGYDAKQLVSTHKLMVPNDTYWRLPEGTELPEIMQRMHAELTEAGWRGGEEAKDNPEARTMRMENDPQFLEVFLERARHYGEEGPRAVYLHYRKRMPYEARHPAMEELLEGDTADFETAFELENFASSEQRKRIHERLINDPPPTVEAYLRLAQLYTDRKNANSEDADPEGADPKPIDQVAESLRRAYGLTFAITDTHDALQQIDQRIKKLELDPDMIKQADPSLFEQIGFVVASPGDPPQSVEVAPGQRATFCLVERAEAADAAEKSNAPEDLENPDAAPEWKIVSFQLGDRGQSFDADMLDFTQVDSGPTMGRSWSHSSSNLKHLSAPSKKAWGHSFNFRFEKLDSHTMRVHVEVDPE